MLVVYSGVHTDIELDLPNGRLLIAERGVPFEVSDEMGASLCEQDTYTEATAPRTDAQIKADAKAAKEAAKAAEDAAAADAAAKAAAEEAANAENATETDGDAAEKE